MNPALNDSLFEAIGEREPAKVEAALRRGASACAPHPVHGDTPLAWALRDPDLAVMNALIHAGARVESEHLFQAARRPWTQAFELLASLAAPEAFQAREDDGLNLAHLLGRQDKYEPLLRLALEGGADPNLPWRDVHVPLDLAINAGAARCAQTLLFYGADPNGLPGQLDTPLVLALRLVDVAKPWIKLARALIDHPKTDIDRPDGRGATAAMWAASRRGDLLEALADRGANLRATMPGGLSPSLLAACKGRLDCLRLLASANACCPLETSDDGRDGAMLAASHGQLAALVFFADLGADLAAKDRAGSTCLDLARHHGHPQCALFIQARLESDALRQTPSAASHAPPRL